MRRISGRAISITLIAVPMLMVGAAAIADSPSDGRAVFYPGNVTTCGGVGLGSDKQIGAEGNKSAGNASVSGTAKVNAGSVQPGTGEELDVATIGDTAVHAVVIHGGNGYNKYADPSSLPPRLQPDQHYIAPLTNGGNVPTLSHWFVCYSAASGTPVPAGALGIFGFAGVAALGLALNSRARRRRRYVRGVGGSHGS
jgi:hypothetical protein